MRIVSINDCPAMLEDAVQWFSARWHIPAEVYRESMTEGLEDDAGIPKWYLAMEGERIAGGCGIIANDFHDRPDLTPNLCALWVEEPFRRRGIAGKLLAHAVSKTGRMGYDRLYLFSQELRLNPHKPFPRNRAVHPHKQSFCCARNNKRYKSNQFLCGL